MPVMFKKYRKAPGSFAGLSLGNFKLDENAGHSALVYTRSPGTRATKAKLAQYQSQYNSKPFIRERELQRHVIFQKT